MRKIYCTIKLEIVVSLKTSLGYKRKKTLSRPTIATECNFDVFEVSFIPEMLTAKIEAINSCIHGS